MGTIKERNCKELAEAEIKKRWQKYTENLYKKDLKDLDNHDGVVTHPETDILSVKSSGPSEALLPIKLVEVMKFQQIYLKSIKVLHSMYQQIWKAPQWTQDWKRSIFIPIPKNGSTKECSDHQTIALISYASKVMLKILQAGLQHT